MGKKFLTLWVRNEPLWPTDIELFASMECNYVSENERIFFETVKEREENVFTFAGDLLVSEDDNDDLIYLMRRDFDEFELGTAKEVESYPMYYVQCLADALNANLKQLGYIDRDVTFLQWLRRRDYDCVRYDRNYDDL
ncbi:MAG: hypothetical protein PUJ24_04065 [Bacteroidales bacterium]|nr:hypothetical protein [Bacteroidales bacterium]